MTIGPKTSLKTQEVYVGFFVINVGACRILCVRVRGYFKKEKVRLFRNYKGENLRPYKVRKFRMMGYCVKNVLTVSCFFLGFCVVRRKKDFVLNPSLISKIVAL